MQLFIAAVNHRLEELSISQSELARRAEMAQPSLSKLLSGKKGNCTLTKCDEIAAALGTTTLALLMETQAE